MKLVTLMTMIILSTASWAQDGGVTVKCNIQHKDGDTPVWTKTDLRKSKTSIIERVPLGHIVDKEIGMKRVLAFPTEKKRERYQIFNFAQDMSAETRLKKEEIDFTTYPIKERIKISINNTFGDRILVQVSSTTFEENNYQPWALEFYSYNIERIDSPTVTVPLTFNYKRKDEVKKIDAEAKVTCSLINSSSINNSETVTKDADISAEEEAVRKAKMANQQ